MPELEQLEQEAFNAWFEIYEIQSSLHDTLFPKRGEVDYKEAARLARETEEVAVTQTHRLERVIGAQDV